MSTIVDKMVGRFLGWKLPKDFGPDCGISFKRESDYDHPEFGRTKFEPIGTNLLNAVQAREMLQHVAEPLLNDRDELAAALERIATCNLRSLFSARRIARAALNASSDRARS